jgi:hypothetical protein
LRIQGFSPYPKLGQLSTTLENKLATACPNRPTLTAIAMAIREAIRAYSMAVTPESSRIKFKVLNIVASLALVLKSSG